MPLTLFSIYDGKSPVRRAQFKDWSMPTYWGEILDVVNLLMGVAGIVLAIVAIIITILFYRFSQAHETSASQMMGKIEENTRILSEIISKVLTQMTRRLAERPPSESPDFLLQVLQVVRPLTTQAAIRRMRGTSGRFVGRSGL